MGKFPLSKQQIVERTNCTGDCQACDRASVLYLYEKSWLCPECFPWRDEHLCALCGSTLDNLQEKSLTICQSCLDKKYPKLKGRSSKRYAELLGVDPVKPSVSFLPIALTRVSPFHMMSRSEVVNNPWKAPRSQVEYENCWGKMVVSGPTLNVRDESVLLAILQMAKELKTDSLHTTCYALCKRLGIKPHRDHYGAICGSLNRMSWTNFAAIQWGHSEVHCHILSNAASSDRFRPGRKLHIALDKIFLEHLSENLITWLDTDYRLGLRTDIAKCLYRFFRGTTNRKDGKILISLEKLAGAVNLSEHAPKDRNRLIRRGLNELKKKHFLKNWQINNGVLVAFVNLGLRKKLR